ncbi:hypothetical protein BD410DRAFT_258163 [Rickenella mellea]|uniref:F-box domain-containing protein n=1 Tax=Rickenella mellea TaxID=50990 RepID=A0A4Y7Q630_9AGAM|nr:hypothetical protein BD410DRAFT_258163 [Rickenella mellea]
MTTVANHRETMPTKLALMRVSRQFNCIVGEFFSDFVYIPSEYSAVRLATLIAPQDECGNERRWGHRRLRMALKKVCPASGRSLKLTVRNVGAHRANINIRYIYLEDHDRYYTKDYAISVANILKSNCCSNLVGLIIAGSVSRIEYGLLTQSVIDAIPSGIKLLSWNAQASEGEFFPLLSRVCVSLERLRICPAKISPQWPVRWATEITFRKLTHFALLGGLPHGCDLQILREWQLPSLTHLTIGKSVMPNSPHFMPLFSSFQNLQYLQIHLGSPGSTQIPIEATFVDEPYPGAHPVVITCHDWSYNFPTAPMILGDILHIFDRKSFPRLKAVDLFGVRSCSAFPWWVTTSEEIENSLREVSQDLALPGVEIRTLS